MAEYKQVNFSNLSHFTPKQKDASEAAWKHDYVLYGGAAGGGKSYWLRWFCVEYLITMFKKTGIKGIRVGIFCEDYPALWDRQISKMKYEFPEWLGKYRGQQKEFVLSEDLGGGVICFRNLDDPSKYLSAEFALIAIDELVKNVEDTFNFLRMRKRWPGISRTKFIAGTNPGGIGHGWVRKKWIDRDFDENEKEEDQFYFIPAKAEDNPHLDEGYFRSLESLPEELRRAYLEGDWDMFAGQYFTEFKREIHVTDPYPINPNWTKFVCGDYGYTNQSAVYWVAIDNEGRAIFYREIYEKKLTHRELAQRIKVMTPPEEEIRYYTFGPDIFHKQGTSGASGADIMRQEGVPLVAANDDRLAGWALMRDYFRPYTGPDSKLTARIQIFDKCPALIRTLPQLMTDPKKPEDALKGGEDHAPDGCRYGLMSIKTPFAQPMVMTKNRKNIKGIGS